MNFLFCKFTARQWVSRAKTLLKRRKQAIKSRPISNKKLQQQAKLFNYAKQYKALQIQKQLDKRRYASQHINQLMDQIFYPDVALANQEAVKIQIQTSTLKQYSKSNLNDDPIENLINKNAAAVQLIEVYNKNSEQFEPNHFLTLFSKFRNYFHRRDQIKQNVEKKWKKMNENMKKNDPNYKQKKCPYLFIDKEDTVHYQPWNMMLESVLQHFQGFLAAQNKQQNLLIFLRIVQELHQAVGYLSYQFYEVFENHLCALNKQQILELPLNYCRELIKCAGLRNRVRYAAYSKINEPEIQRISKSNQNKILLVTRLLSDPEATFQNFLDVIRAIRSGVILIDQKILQMLKEPILTNLANLPFERVTDLLILYLKQNNVGNLQLIQLIKFDALRKSPNAIDKKSLLICMELVSKKQLYFRKNHSQVAIEGYDLFYACSSVLCSRYCGSNKFSYSQVINIIDMFYSNSLSDVNLLQLMASQLVKIRQQASLSEYTSCIFKIYILGYHSPVLSKILFNQYKNKYLDTLKRIKSEEIKYLKGQVDPNKQQGNENELDKLPMAQLALQQDLIISLWLLFKSRQYVSKPPVPVDELLKIFPTNVQSRHPLIYQMCLNLNKWNRDLSILFQISVKAPMKRKTNNIEHRLDKYYNYENKNQIAKVMKIQAINSGLFFNNYHLEPIDARKFVPEVWSENYCFCLQDYLKEIAKDPHQNNYFKKKHGVSEEIIKLRKLLIKNFKQFQQKKINQGQNSNKKQQQRYYQID